MVCSSSAPRPSPNLVRAITGLMLLMLVHVSVWSAAADSVTPYPLGAGDQTSALFAVSVNGVSVPVYNNGDMSYAHFAFTGTAQVVVTIGQNIAQYGLSPHGYALAPQVSGNDLRFTVDRPRKVIVHNPGNAYVEKLCIFAEAPEDHPPKIGDPQVATLNGLDASGSTDVTTQLQAAVDNMPEGSTLLIPAGRYTFTYLQLRSNKSYYLAPGAILQAPRTQEAQIKLNGCRNVKIYGRGVLDDQGDFQRARTGGGETGTTFISADQNSGSANVVFEDLIIRNPSIFTCIVFDTQNWQMRNLKILSNFNYGNRDGIDPHNAQHLVVDDCFFLITDDAIAYSTLHENIDADVAVKNCVMYNTGFRIGPWVGNNTRNFTAENCDRIKGPKGWGSCFDIYAGGSLSNVRFRNMRIEDPGAQLIYLISNWNDYYAGVKSGSIDNIRFENMSVEHVTSDNASLGIDASVPSSPISNIAFTNFNYGGTIATQLANIHSSISGSVTNLTFTSVAANVVSISAESLSASSAQPTWLNISRTGPVDASVTIPLIIRGSGIQGSDYTSLASSALIPAGSRSTTVAIAPLRSTFGSVPVTVMVDLDRSTTFSYLLGPDHCAMVRLVDSGQSGTAPAITSQPASMTVTAGQTATFMVAASGTGPLSYQWKFGSTNVGSNGATLSLANAQAANAGSYTCVVTNGAGTATSTAATLTVNAASVGPVGTGTGLTGTYFPSVDFTGASVTRIDATVNFDWGLGSPITGIPVDHFSVRWTGQVQAQFSETYTFSTVSDDGVRLWVNGQQLVNNWTVHGPIEDSGTITLVAGQKYDLKMEYYDNTWGATATLSWASPSTAKQIIPMTQLFPSGDIPGALPAGWTAQDVGGVAVGGSTTQSNGTWTVSGSGADIWDSADGCRFASQRVTGDVQVTAQVSGLTNTNEWAKAGVMIRESLTAGSRHASTFATAANGLAFQRRLATDGVSSHTAGPNSPTPYWVRIERVGDVVMSSTSPDGTTWTEIRRESIAMSAAVYVGLAVTSHNNGSLCTATFTNVQVVGVPTAAN